MDEPNYQITDASGTVVGEIGADANGDPVVSKPGGGSVTITDDGIKTPAVSTEQTQIKNTTDGDTNATLIIDESDATDSHGGYIGYQKQNDVGTTATEIFDMGVIPFSGQLVGGGLITVSGRVQGGTDAFTDTVQIVRAGDPVVVEQTPVGSPDTRSYARNGTEITLSMSANTYNIVVDGSYAFTAV